MRCTVSHGFTLIELVLTLAVAALLAVAAAPPALDLLDRQRLRGAAENIYSDLLLARSESLRLNAPVSVTFRSDPTDGRWCYAMSDAGPCDCLGGHDCRVSGAPARRATNADFNRVRLSTNLKLGTATFHPARGTVNAGTVTLAAGARSVDVIMSTLGRVRLCSDQLGAYPPC